MTVTNTISMRGLFSSMIAEPLELAMSQPHQALISSASVFLVAAEAGKLVDSPFNVLMAVGAEWAYLRGLSSAEHANTPWVTRLNWAAVILVIAYGSLYGFRKFGVVPEQPEPWLGVLLTLIHILCIGAVTLCSAMVHRAMLAERGAKATERETHAAEREQRLQDERDEQARQAEAQRLANIQAFREQQQHEARQRVEWELQQQAADREAKRQQGIEDARAQRQVALLREKATARQQVDNGVSTSKRNPLDGVDVVQEVARLGSAAAVAREYKVSRQAVDNRLKRSRQQVDTQLTEDV